MPPTPGKLTGKDVQAALEKLSRNLGGLTVTFRPDTHVGLDYVDIGVVDDSGQLLY